MSYSKAAVGGTFDHFHLGHQELLKTASKTANHLVIGITDQNLIQTKTDADLIETYEVRENSVTSWLHQNRLDSSTQIVKLTDPYGPTLTDLSIDSLVVSEVTTLGANKLNQLRTDKNLVPLPVVITPMVLDEANDYISSTKIRQGYITRNGRVTQKLFDHDIIFDKHQLQQLSQPQGELFEESKLTQSISLLSKSHVYLVGDMVTQLFLKRELPFSAAIIDGQTKRTKLTHPIKPTVTIEGHNQPGTINHQVAKNLIAKLELDSPQSIYEVHGEEDLLAFVPVLIKPLKSLILYGQPDGGIVMITLTEAIKLRLGKILDPNFS